MSHPSPRERARSRARRRTIVPSFGLLIAIALACGAPPDPLEEIRHLHAAGRFAETVEPLRRLVDEDLGRIEAQLLLGRALLRTGEVGLAVWPLQRAAESPEHAVPAGILLTRALLEGRSAQDAVRAIDRVLEIAPDEPEALQLRVEAQLDAGDPEKALADIDRLLELDPSSRFVLVPRVLALIATSRIDEAEAALETARSQLEETGDEVDAPARARLCIARGLFAFEKGEAETADEQYAACLVEFPAEPLVIAEAVRYYDRTDRSERATELLREAADRPGGGGYRLMLAQRMGARGDADAQLELLRKSAEEQASPTAWFALADFHVQRDEFEPALEAFERALAASPNPPAMLRFAYADTLVQAGRLDQAMALAEGLDHEALRELVRGRVLLERGDAQSALAAFEAGIRLWPNNAASRFLAGQAAERVGDFERAVTEYRESVRANPAQTKAGLALGELHAASGSPAAALDALRRYVNTHRDDPEGYLVTVRVARRAGQERTAADVLTRLAELPGQAARARAAEATLVAEAEGPDAAIAALERSGLDFGDPANAPALRVLLDQLTARGDPASAAQRSSAALAAHPDAAVFHELHGRALRAAGRPPELARESFERALELDPEHAPALVGLAELASANGEIEAAVALYDRAAVADPSDPTPARAAARLLLDAAEGERAERRLAELLLRHPRDAETALVLATSLATRGERERAQDLALRAAWFGTPGADALVEQLRGDTSDATP